MILGVIAGDFLVEGSIGFERKGYPVKRLNVLHESEESQRSAEADAMTQPCLFDPDSRDEWEGHEGDLLSIALLAKASAKALE